MKNRDNKMSRKEFLKKSSFAFLGAGLLGRNTGKTFASTRYKTVSSHRELGKTGLLVSSIGFGASRTMEPALVNAALDRGVNFLDTGRSYFRGQNEVMVGKVISSIRKNVIVQSKLRVRLGEENIDNVTTDELQNTINSMQSSMNESMKALGTDYIDIMLIHGASSVRVIHHETIMEFFEKAKKAGKIRAHGFSSHSNQVELLRAAKKNPFYDVVMVPYNHKGSYIHSNSGQYSEWDQPALEVEMKKAINNEIGLIAMKTCSGGPLARDTGSSPSYEVALRWILKRDMVHTMAVAMGNFDQIEENLAAMD